MPKTAAMARTQQSGTAADVDEIEAEAAEIDPTDAELPAFLTEDDAAGVALNGASAS